MGRQPRPHVLASAYPAQGHVGPLMKLCLLIARHGIKVTFVTAACIHAQMLAAAEINNGKAHNSIDIVSIPDGLDPQDGRKDRIQLSQCMQRVMPSHLESMIKKADLSEDHEKITCVIADVTVAWVLDTAKNMGVKTAMFWRTIVAGFALGLCIQHLIETKIIDHNAMSTDDLIWSCPGDPIRQKIIFGNVTCANRTVKISDWLLCNSFHELEPSACDTIPNLLPIGPLISTSLPGKPAASLWPEDSTCLNWLDKQPSQSVIYVAFGSIAIVNQHQFEELALGLELAGRPFLWVVRPNLLDGSKIKYPDGFSERVADRSKIIDWAPQGQALAHSSVACFISHCVWNSTIQGLSMGVPFLCWPYFADQFLIRNNVCDFWKVGLGLKQDESGIMSRHEIKRKLDELLSYGCIRQNGLKIKEMAKKSLGEGVSSVKKNLRPSLNN